MALVISHLLNRTADVYREVLTADGRGGRAASEERVHEGISVRVPQATVEERVLAQQAGARWDVKIYCLAGTDIRRGDVFRLLDTGEKFEAVDVIAASSAGVYTRADCTRTQHAGVSP
ncbi:hypothetical protein ACIQFP_10580 [Nocardiopsis alba]|uniref:hypothetical protein n=1 Tax=Nocardiopsis alba TaxID=53437 RepID=UPI0038285A3A